MLLRSLMLVAALLLAGCASTPQGATNSAIYSAKLAFDGAVKTFNALKAACEAKALPQACRTYVVQGQGIIARAYAYERAANAAELSAAVARIVAIVEVMRSLKGA